MEKNLSREGKLRTFKVVVYKTLNRGGEIIDSIQDMDTLEYCSYLSIVNAKIQIEQEVLDNWGNASSYKFHSVNKYDTPLIFTITGYCPTTGGISNLNIGLSYNVEHLTDTSYLPLTMVSYVARDRSIKFSIVMNNALINNTLFEYSNTKYQDLRIRNMLDNSLSIQGLEVNHNLLSIPSINETILPMLYIGVRPPGKRKFASRDIKGEIYALV